MRVENRPGFDGCHFTSFPGIARRRPTAARLGFLAPSKQVVQVVGYRIASMGVYVFR